MKKLKLSLKIVAALFIFAVIGLVSCNKSSFGLDENENVYSEDASGNGYNIVKQENITKEELIKQLSDAGKIISVNENYAVPETDLTGILYKYTDYKGNEKEFVVLDKEPKQEDFKGIFPHVFSVVHWVEGFWGNDGIYHITNQGFSCTGGGSGCYGWTNIYIIY